MTNINKKMTIKGNKVQDVGYRLFLLDEAERMLVTHLDVKNLKDKTTVEVLIGGDEDRVDKFVEFVKNNFPEYADVDKPVADAENYEGDIRTVESFSRCLSVHQLTKFATIGNKIAVGQDMLRTETNQNFERMGQNFDRMDAKYHIISERMFALVDAIEKRQQSFETHIEKIDKNIETLLEILVKKQRKD